MKVTVLYFARLADKSKRTQEDVEINPTITLPDLYSQLQHKYGFTLDKSQLRVAINDEFAQWTDDLSDGDTIAFIPPVAGG